MSDITIRQQSWGAEEESDGGGGGWGGGGGAGEGRGQEGVRCLLIDA